MAMLFSILLSILSPWGQYFSLIDRSISSCSGGYCDEPHDKSHYSLLHLQDWNKTFVNKIHIVNINKQKTLNKYNPYFMETSTGCNQHCILQCSIMALKWPMCINIPLSHINIKTIIIITQHILFLTFSCDDISAVCYCNSWYDVRPLIACN